MRKTCRCKVEREVLLQLYVSGGFATVRGSHVEIEGAGGGPPSYASAHCCRCQASWEGPIRGNPHVPAWVRKVEQSVIDYSLSPQRRRTP